MIPNFTIYKERWQLPATTEIQLGLTRIQRVLEVLQHPERAIPIIHVAGTNGKGSTIAYMQTILQQAGYTVGTFTSPAIVDVCDQIRIDGQAISSEELHQSCEEVQTVIQQHPITDFELLTVLAFCTFRRKRPAIVLVEAGMGGATDSTNVVNPLVAVIPSIGLDHIGFLGTTIEEIAEQKAGIIKWQRPVVVGPLEETVQEVMKYKAQKQESALYCVQTPYEGKTGLVGQHQAYNAAVACEAVRQSGLSVPLLAYEKGIEMAYIPNRFEQIQPMVWLDGAHNEAAAQALAQVIHQEIKQPVHIVIGMLATKDVKAVCEQLVPVAASFTCLTFAHEEAITKEQWQEWGEQQSFPVFYEEAQQWRPAFNSQPTVVTGSLYLLQQVRNQIIQ